MAIKREDKVWVSQEMVMRLEKKLTEAIAENQKLKAQCQSYCDTAHEATREVTRLRAINKELGEALSRILLDYSPNPNSEIFQSACKQAREALALAEKE